MRDPVILARYLEYWHGHRSYYVPFSYGGANCLLQDCDDDDDVYDNSQIQNTRIWNENSK